MSEKINLGGRRLSASPAAGTLLSTHLGRVLGIVDRFGEPAARAGLYGSLALIYAWFGGMKFTEYEANGIATLVQASPLLSWSYSILSIQGFSYFLGGLELTIALLIAARLASPALSAIGGLLSAGLFMTTLGFMISTPGVLVPELGFPATTVAPGQFLLKDVGLLAISLWIAVESLTRLAQPDRPGRSMKQLDRGDLAGSASAP